ncbi:MAG: tetratricopeptide repeat protein [Candidatus Omnitrophica bacterium]|nr:tetratricopeptide repeat protein [Candidatus Omnitrophota bacterium]
MKKLLFIAILILFLSIIWSECWIRFCRGTPIFEPDPQEFKYRYVDIYEKFFKKVRKKNEALYVPQREHCNSKEFPVVNAPDTIRIFIIGGSVAYNFSYFPFEKSLKSLEPNKNFEVISCGMGAYDSYRTYLVEKEILAYEPDIIIVLSGNNEFYNKVRINLTAYYANKSLRNFWIYRLLQDRFLKWSKERGMGYFRDKKERLVDYEKNIRLIAKKAKSKGVSIILCTIPVNFKDSPPAVDRSLNKNYFYGHFLLEHRDYANAIIEFNKFLRDSSDSDKAYGFYFLGRTYEKMNNYQKAKEFYLKALELCYGNGRASSRSNEIVRRICAEENVGCADLEAAFINMAPTGLLGREQFADNCHWYLEYDSLVAEAIIRIIFKDRNIGYNKLNSFSFSHDFPSLEERGKRDDEVMNQIRYAAWQVIMQKGLSERAISRFETLYLMSPTSIRKIRFLKDEIKATLLHYEWPAPYIHNFEEHWPSILYHTGETYRRLGLYNESLEYFNEATFLDEKFYLAYIGRGLIYYALGDSEKASESLNRAKEISDNNIEVKYYKEILGL